MDSNLGKFLVCKISGDGPKIRSNFLTKDNKEIYFFTGKGYHLHIYCHRIEKLLVFYEIVLPLPSE